jgi:hypothetical protein
MNNGQVPFDVLSDSEYGDIRAKLEAGGHPIGGKDAASVQDR